MAETSEIDMREQLVRIDRMIEESRKFSEETRKFTAEQHKLTAEAAKLTTEAAKLSRDRVLQTLLAVTGLIGGILTVAQFFFRVRGTS